MSFADRVEAGRALAVVVGERIAERTGVAVLGLPRGGIPVAFEVARAIGAPLDAIFVRKIGVPGQPELAMGAIGEDGVRVVNTEIVRAARVTPDVFARVEAHEREELARRAARVRSRHPRVALEQNIAVIVDDGIATGSTVRAACAVARAHGARRVIVAAPVAPASTIESLRSVADDVVVVTVPASFYAIGQLYDDFSATTDDEVVALLDRAGGYANG